MPRLSDSQRRQLRDDGYVVIAGAVPQASVETALRAINAALGAGIDPARLEAFQSQSFCPELREDPAVTGLFQATDARQLVDDAVGKAVWPHPQAQIALRFPRPPGRKRQLYPHIDGFYSPQNGLESGRIATFMGLAGIFLSDVRGEWAGNFTVWPGTHRTFERYFRTHPPTPDLKDGLPPVELPSPVQLQVRAGDLVIAHYQLAHTAAPNDSAHVRYAVFTRFTHADHVKRGLEVFGNIWLEWEAMQLSH